MSQSMPIMVDEHLRMGTMIGAVLLPAYDRKQCQLTPQLKRGLLP
jgi:hypothetical protein